VDIEQLPDGSLLVSDDTGSGGTVYRISYSQPTTCRSNALGVRSPDVLNPTGM